MGYWFDLDWTTKEKGKHWLESRKKCFCKVGLMSHGGSVSVQSFPDNLGNRESFTGFGICIYAPKDV